jgi:CubicO group peptidase (beta-lactamase class C family)
MLQSFVDNHSLAGVVTLVAGKEKVLALETAGYADIAGDRPMRPDTLFWIASTTKPITATALMMLVDEGKVNLDDAVQDYLPEFKGQWLVAEQDDAHLLLKKPQHPITVRNILAHTSGLPYASAMEQPTLDQLTLREASLSYAMTSLRSEPDTRYQYSNAGINTAGRILEVVSGMPYEEFLQKRLLDPLGMKDTTFWPNKEQLSRLATPYRPSEDLTRLEATTYSQLTYPLDDPSRQPIPAGGLFSTAEDQVRFGQMILHGGVFAGRRYLSELSVAEMTRRQTPVSIPENYGLGWHVDEVSCGHSGAFTHLQLYPQRGLILVFLVQHTGNGEAVNKCYAEFRVAAEAMGTE